MTKDQAAPLTSAIAADLMNAAYRKAVVPSKLQGAIQILKGQAVPDVRRGALPILPAAFRGPEPIDAPNLMARIKGAANYALMGDPRAFFPPGLPLQPQAPAEAAGRKWDYPFYYNVQIQPRAYESITFDLLRSMSEAHDLLRCVIESAKNRICYQEWNIMQVEDEDTKKPGKQIPSGTKDRMRWATNFFRRPDLKRPFSTWSRELIDDMLTIDAMTLYSKPTLSGTPHSLVPIDGATINVKMDYWGNEPEAPDTAYQQILKGLPSIDYTDQDVFYLPFNRRTHKAYGYSPIEQIMVTINIAIRRQWYQLQHYISGAHTPYLIKTPPDWNQDQIEGAQTWYNSQFVDNLAQRHRAILLPNGCEPLTQSVKIEEHDSMDDWLAGLICYAFSVDRSTLIKPMNRASAQHGGDQSDKEGFMPFSHFFETSMTDIIHLAFGWEDIRFSWADQQDFMAKEKSDSIKTYMEHGVYVIDEVRDMLGMDPLPNGAGQQCVLGANMQLVQIDDVNKLSDQNAQKAQQQDLANQSQQASIDATKSEKVSGVSKPNGNAQDNKGAGSKVGKGFDVSPSPLAGLQPYGGNNRTRTMMHARGKLRHAGRKRKAKVTRTASLAVRKPDDARIGQLKAVMVARLKAQAQRVADGVTARLRKFEKADKPTKLVHRATINQLLAKGWEGAPDEIAPILEGAAADTAATLIASAGVDTSPESWDVIDEATTQLARDRAAEMVGMKWVGGELVENPNPRWAITEDVRDELTNLVAQAEQENWSNNQLKDAILNADTFSESRADMIARTELKTIDAMSADATANATGASQKRWMLSANHDQQDDCDDNEAADWIPIDEEFPSGANLPPDHPRCQCVVTFGWEDPG